MPTDLPAAARRVAEWVRHYGTNPRRTATVPAAAVFEKILPLLDASAAELGADRVERWTAAVRAACEHGSATTISYRRIAEALAALADAERAAASLDSDAAHALVRGIYEETGGATPALRDAYAAYRTWEAGVDGEERAAAGAEGWAAYEQARLDHETAAVAHIRGGSPDRLCAARAALDAAVRRLAGMGQEGKTDA